MKAAAKSKPTIRRKLFERPQINPEGVYALAQYVAKHRGGDADASDSPDSYANGCSDGRAMAELALFELVAQGSADEPLEAQDEFMAHVFGVGDSSEAGKEYRHGLLVGYLDHFNYWAAMGLKFFPRGSSERPSNG